MCFFQVLDFHNKHLYGLSFWSTFGRIKKGGLAGVITSGDLIRARVSAKPVLNSASAVLSSAR